jgi:nucleoside-diphosphate-sugar epimerase
MKVFVTGATGYIGGAVSRALVASGHEVTGLVRAESKSKVPEGVRVVEGGLGDLLGMLGEVETHDVFVHAAQSHSPDMVDLDEAAVEAFTRFRDGDRYLAYTSGVWVLGSTGSRVDDEATPPDPIAMVAWRPGHEKRVIAASRDGFATAVIRPGCVYGHGQSLLADWFSAAEKNEPVNVVGEGNNKWSLIHLDDLAAFYLTAIEKRENGILHAVDDSRNTLNEMAEAVIKAKGSSSGIDHVPGDVATEKMGPFAEALMIDQQVSSLDSRQRLGWEPKRDFMGSVEEQWGEWGEK